MRITFDLPTAGVLLRWGGLLAVVLAIIGGLVGMHVVAGGSPATTSMSMGSPAASNHVMPDGDHLADAVVTHSAAHNPAPIKAAFNCPATENTAGMAMPSGCTPTLSSTALTIPLPGTLTQFAPGAAFLPALRHTAADRSLDPPSLEQLSINRT